MTVDEVRAEVDRIIAIGWDSEQMHSAEDDLLADLVRDYCPPAIVAEIERLAAAPFSRWCA